MHKITILDLAGSKKLAHFVHLVLFGTFRVILEKNVTNIRILYRSPTKKGLNYFYVSKWPVYGTGFGSFRTLQYGIFNPAL